MVVWGGGNACVLECVRAKHLSSSFFVTVVMKVTANNSEVCFLNRPIIFLYESYC